MAGKIGGTTFLSSDFGDLAILPCFVKYEEGHLHADEAVAACCYQPITGFL